MRRRKRSSREPSTTYAITLDGHSHQDVHRRLRIGIKMADALSRTLRARVRLIRDGADMHDQVFYDPDVSYDESTHQRVVLSTNMASPAEVDMAGVSTAGSLFLKTDRAILVGLVSNTRTWPVGENGAVLLVGSFSHLYLQNESTTNQATVDLVVTD